jgi:hypothetical protein
MKYVRILAKDALVTASNPVPYDALRINSSDIEIYILHVFITKELPDKFILR